MESTPKKSKLGTTGKIVWRVIFPFTAIKTTAVLMRKEIDIHKENIARIKSLGNEAKESLNSKNLVSKEVSFQELVGENNSEIEKLFLIIQEQKRVLLLTGALFIFGFLLIFCIACFKGHTTGILFSFFASFFAFAMTFIMALKRQICLWQLKNKKISMKEHGDFESFKKDTPHWIKATLNPKAISY